MGTLEDGLHTRHKIFKFPLGEFLLRQFPPPFLHQHQQFRLVSLAHSVAVLESFVLPRQLVLRLFSMRLWQHATSRWKPMLHSKAASSKEMLKMLAWILSFETEEHDTNLNTDTPANK